MKKFIITSMMILSVSFLFACGGSSSSDPVPNSGDVCPNPEAHVYYNTYAPIAEDYSITSKEDLLTRLNFYDEFKTIIGSNSASTISNLINNSSELSSFYNTWNPIIGSTTKDDYTKYITFYNTWNSIIGSVSTSEYNIYKSFYDTWNSTIGSTSSSEYDIYKNFYSIWQATVGSYTPAQITQFINGPIQISGKKVFLNNILHGKSWDKFATITYGFTTAKPSDIQVNIVNRNTYQVLDTTNIVTKMTNGFKIEITNVPAGVYIVTVSGNYVVAGVSSQETEVGCFNFTR